MQEKLCKMLMLLLIQSLLILSTNAQNSCNNLSGSGPYSFGWINIIGSVLNCTANLEECLNRIEAKIAGMRFVETISNNFCAFKPFLDQIWIRNVKKHFVSLRLIKLKLSPSLNLLS